MSITRCFGYIYTFMSTRLVDKTIWHVNKIINNTVYCIISWQICDSWSIKVNSVNCQLDKRCVVHTTLYVKPYSYNIMW
jgi:hypothetical protein